MREKTIKCKQCRFFDWDKTNENDLKDTKIGEIATATACWCKNKRQFMPFDGTCINGVTTMRRKLYDNKRTI